MSTTNLEHDQLITCDLCQRRYHINVYQRHRNENQCLKRNQQRLPFESIKQRSVQIGDKTFSVQQASQQTNKHLPLLNSQENRKQQISNHKKQSPERSERILPSNTRRRTLEQAKQLLERRIKYQPPWIQKRSNLTNELQPKLNRTNTIVLHTKDLSTNAINSQVLTKQLIHTVSPHRRSSPPTTKFKNDNIPIKISDRRVNNHTGAKQPILAHSPKLPTSHASTTSNYPSSRIDQIFSHEQTNGPCRPMRKAYTWTRSSKQSSVRDVISPIHIPTFQESASGPSHGRIAIPFNPNYDNDEFERYSPTPPSTPKHQQNRTRMKTMTINAKQNVTVDEQQILIRPNTYQKARRSERQQQNEIPFHSHSNAIPRKNSQSIFHLPPINPTSYSKLKHHRTTNPTPWR